ncbi:MAG: M15 family metallopeptidase [Bacteroidetes bacterium]|nr:M15 family metallopeptidase [Bacteroidota bacterium]
MFTSKEYDKYYNSPTWDKHTNERLKQIDPKMRDDARAMINELYEKYGIKLRIGHEVFRSVEEQDKLFLKGRDPVTKEVINQNEVVTSAPGGASMHNYRLAFDLLEIINDNGESKIKSFDRKKVLKIAFKYGFRWGGYFSGTKYDPPHFERTYGFHWSVIKKKALSQKTKYINLFK